jgi:hypothetical protein
MPYAAPNLTLVGRASGTIMGPVGSSGVDRIGNHPNTCLQLTCPYDTLTTEW